MVNQRHCPYCKAPSTAECRHLALVTEGRHFVRRCVEMCSGQKQWQALCQHRRQLNAITGNFSTEREDYMWLETAFCEQFLKPLRWFGGMEYEWRTGPRMDQGGFWVLLWSKDPQRLWWELRDQFERQMIVVLLPERPQGEDQLGFGRPG